MARAVVITGGNLGDIAANMKMVRELIGHRVGDIITTSSVMDSQAWGFAAEEQFLNQVLVVQTELEPLELLVQLQNIEVHMGRVREVGAERYVSRTMDIDILFYDDIVLETDVLQIPHPRLSERAFVLRPLCEVMGEYTHPQSHKSIKQIFSELKD